MQPKHVLQLLNKNQKNFPHLLDLLANQGDLFINF